MNHGCRSLLIFVLALYFVGSAATINLAQLNDIQNHCDRNSVSANSLNFKIKTLGGKQFWTDILYRGGWRVQENGVVGHYRLLDPDNNRTVSGTKQDCTAELERLTSLGRITADSGRVVIVTHGLIRTTSSMRRLGDYLESNSDLTAINFEYASTRRPVAYHATSLAAVIDSLGAQVTEINFVAHSMGNIVIRHYLADLEKSGHVEPRLRRMVMIGPPNQGSKIARLLKRSFLFNFITGSSGWELGAGWDRLETKLATPDFEFGIIAGGQTDNTKISNFLLDGKDDFTVSVDETKLVGATDFLVEPLLHGTMMRQDVTLQATLQFLEHGFFVSADQRQPIEK